jgi:phosphoglycerate kinase
VSLYVFRAPLRITVIENILDKVDHMWWRNDLYFRKALGGKIGDSICEDDKQELALEILRLAKEKEFKFISP